MEDGCSAVAADVPDKPSSLSSDKRRSGAGKRVAVAVTAVATTTAPAQGLGPCGACKFLRRKCVSGCVFAPYFGSDQGAARFAAVHKVFGASNVSKLLVHVPATQRQDAVLTISYEAQARLSDPVYGCVATILALQQQVASLQAELSMVQTQLLSSRLAVANALQNSQQQNQNHNHHHHQCQQHHNITVLQPEYSNNSSTSTNLMNMSGYPSNFDLASETALSSRSFIKPLHLSGPAQDDDEDEEDSRNNPVIFSNHTLQEK